MTTRERRPDERVPTVTEQTAQQNAPESGLRATGDVFLAAADLAIERALSGAPEAFLAQNRQLGGQ